jgi:hypothetical protein
LNCALRSAGLPSRGSERSAACNCLGPPSSVALRGGSLRSFAALRAKTGSESFFRECPPGSGFQVTPECYRAVPVSKCNGGFNPPRTEFLCVGNFAAIVPPQAVAKVFSHTDLKLLGMRLAFQDVNVMEFHPSLRSFAALRALQPAGLPSRSLERCYLPLLQPAFAFCATARQSSLLRCAPSEDWRRRELNPRP